MSKKHIIWSDTIFKDRKSMERWAADVREMLIEDGEEPDEATISERIEDDNYMFLDDERCNLKSIDAELNEPIICIGDLGLWRGRFQGYREVERLSDCLYATVSGQSYCKWYVDEYGDFRAEESHHDGTNYYLYRMWKPGTSEAQRDNLKDKIYSGNATKQDINRCTIRLGDFIGQIYGWSFRGRKPSVA